MKDEAEEKFNEYKERKFKRYRSKKELKEKLLPIFRERSIAKKANVKLESPKEADVWDFTLKLKHPVRIHEDSSNLYHRKRSLARNL